MSFARYSFVDCELEPPSYLLTRRGQPVQIEPRVFELLVYLIEHRDRMIGKEELFQALWPRKDVTDSVLTHAIYAARRAVGDDSRQQSVIKTVHGRGYQFIAEVIEIPAIEERPVMEPAQPAGSQPDEPPSLQAVAADTATAPSRTVGRLLRPVWLMPAGLLIVIAGVAAFWRPLPAPPERIAVAPFSVDANADDLGWGELALPGLLAEVLTERSGVRVVPANRVRQALKQKGLDTSAGEQEQIRALRDVFGIDHVLFASVGREDGRLRVNFDLVGAGDGRRRSGSVVGVGAGSLTGQLAEQVARELNVAYAAGIPVRKIAADEFLNEAFARGLSALLGGELADALRYFETCLASDPDNGWARYEMGNALQLLGHWEDAADAYAKAHTRADADGDLNLVGVAASGLGMLAWRRGRLDEAAEHFQTALERFAAVGRRANLASAHGNLGILADNRGDLAAARRHYETALSLYRGEGERAGESAVYSNLAVIERKQGRLAAAAELQQRAIDLQHQAGLKEMLVFSLSHLGEIERDRGHWETAQQLLDQAVDTAESTGSRIGHADALAARAGLAIDLGERASAEAQLRAAHAIYLELDSPAGAARVALRLATLMENGDPHQSRELAADALRSAERLGDESLALESELAIAGLGTGDLARILPRVQTLGDHRLLALSWATRARLERQPAHLRTALAHAERAGGARLQAELALELGRMLIARGDYEDIEPLLGRAEAWKPDFPQTLLLRACYLAGSRPPEAERLLAEARRLPGGIDGDVSWCPDWR